MNIVVKKDKRHQGIGQKLLQELFKLAKEIGLVKINLEVNINNTSAINLYEKFGFKSIGRRPKYYNNINDAIIMEKKV